MPLLQSLNGGLGGHLLSLLLAVAGAGTYGLSVEGDLHKEALVVVGALLAHQAVLKDLAALPLDQLLKGGLRSEERRVGKECRL